MDNAKRDLNEDGITGKSLKLAQAYGRSIRSKENWANICILDSAFNYFLKRNAGILSDWFLQAIRDHSRDI